MLVNPRVWNVVFHVHADRTASVRVSVNARALLPPCDSQSIAQALHYTEAVLVDYRSGDVLWLRAQGTGMLLNLRAADANRGLAWLREHAAELSQAIAQPAARSPTLSPLSDPANLVDQSEPKTSG